MFLDKLKHSYFACLSILILAICSLMLLPIEGYCGWTYMDEGYSSFSDSSYESNGGGWTLTGSVIAGSKNASASMGPSINNPTAFDGPYGIRVADYTGGATVEASREACTVKEYCSGNCKFEHYGNYLGCWGHWTEKPAKTDYGSGSFLQAWVLMVERTKKYIIWVEKNDPTDTFKVSVPLGETIDMTAERVVGGKTYRIGDIDILKKIVPEAQPSESVNAYVSGRAEASKSAAVYYFYFAGNSYDSADASYTTYGE